MYNKNVAITGCTIEKTTTSGKTESGWNSTGSSFRFIVMAAAHSPAIYIPISDCWARIR